MKTKSKRFLNLATLCLALLGTTLLMEQPVKAETSTVRSLVRGGKDYQRDYEEGLKAGKEAARKKMRQNHQLERTDINLVMLTATVRDIITDIAKSGINFIQMEGRILWKDLLTVHKGKSLKLQMEGRILFMNSYLRLL
ncbi:Uncharacterised protein [Streptococcus pyogenes]|uniref:hypothetical protein n=1 Tax=Streptococcus pyogenes TaxID=1314 RepID=UPI0010D17180|nr:hypothetical protein [Streptococcus pyogenes]VHE09202.1 Uncharacterised protein [Streptococcus pyogenes]